MPKAARCLLHSSLIVQGRTSCLVVTANNVRCRRAAYSTWQKMYTVMAALLLAAFCSDLGHCQQDYSLTQCRYAAFAVNYFIGSGPFIRALRYWALNASSLAQQKAPSANGFKLSDTVLVPLIRQPRQRLESGQVRSNDVLVPPGIECDDETQIFEILGLHYVPPYMRYFGTNYQ